MAAKRVVSELPATGEFPHLVGNAVQSPSQTAGQAAGQVTSRFARHTSDFDMFPDKSKQAQRSFTLSEVAQCTGQDGGCLYVVYEDMVLNVTDFAPFHCGGSAVLQRYGGGDASAAMRSSGMPAQVFDTFLQKFVVGRIVPSPSSSPASSSTASAPTRSPAAVQTSDQVPALLGICKN